MKPYSDLNTTYHWSNVAASRFFQSRKIALFIAVLGCLSLGTSGATAQSLSKISCQTNSFSSAGTNACSVYLSGVAQSQIPVYLYSSDSALTVRSTIYVKAGASTGGFSATLASVLSARTVWITAQTSNGNKVTYGIQLAPPASTSLSQPQLSKISCHSNSFGSAGTDACSAYLTSTTSSQIALNLSSNNPAVTVSSHAWVLAGRSTAGFNLNVQSVTTAQVATITASAGGVSKIFSIQLSPSGSAPTPVLTVNATSIPFGAVSLNSKTTQTVTLTSSGTAPVTVNSAVVTGTGFSMSGSSFPVTLNPGQTLGLNLQFAPTAAGSATGQLTITSNSSSNPTASFALSGTATSTSHQIELSWSSPAGSSDPVMGYNIYRAAGGTTSYQRLNSSPVGPTTYTDSAVTSGKAYVYMVKSVDGAGTESPASNTSTATVPAS